MTLGELAGMVAAIAFVVLVVFICLNLSKFSKILEEIKDTVNRLNTTIDVVTKDVDNLSIEVEGLLNKANTLVDDVNGKLSKTDPLFTAIGDLGVTVSDLNDSTKNMTSNLLKGVTKKKQSPIEKFVSSAKGLGKRQPSPSKPVTDPLAQSTIHPESTIKKKEADVEVPRPGKPNMSSESELFTIKNKRPSTTAGEISIKQ
ncbi:DUF948 domain-containing protein [Aerococcaceae bacterium WGS1372]